MIQVHIELSSQLQNKAAAPLETIEVEQPCSVQDCIKTLACECGNDFSRFIFDDAGALRNTILLSVNNVQIYWEDHQLLKDGDIISIVSPIAGG